MLGHPNVTIDVKADRDVQEGYAQTALLIMLSHMGPAKLRLALANLIFVTLLLISLESQLPVRPGDDCFVKFTMLDDISSLVCKRGPRPCH